MKSIFMFSLLVFVYTSPAQMTQSIGHNRAEIVQDLFNHDQANHRSNETQMELLQQSGSDEKKNVGLAAIYSFLLPGMGELYAGEYGMGKYFTIAEGALWVTLMGFDRYAHWLQDDAREFAVQHAKISISGKEDQYFSDIGDYQDIYQYKDAVTKSRKPELLYTPEAAYFWSWDDKQNRATYRDLRVASDERFNDTRFVVAAIGVNHLISAINAASLTYFHNKHTEQGGVIDVHATLLGGIDHPSGIMLSVSRSF